MDLYKKIHRSAGFEGGMMTGKGDYHISVMSDDGTITTEYYQTEDEYAFALGTSFCPYVGDDLQQIKIGSHAALFKEYHRGDAE